MRYSRKWLLNCYHPSACDNLPPQIAGASKLETCPSRKHMWGGREEKQQGYLPTPQQKRHIFFSVIMLSHKPLKETCHLNGRLVNSFNKELPRYHHADWTPAAEASDWLASFFPRCYENTVTVNASVHISLWDTTALLWNGIAVTVTQRKNKCVYNGLKEKRK